MANRVGTAARAAASLLVLSFALGGGAARASTLAEAITMAYAHNPQLQAQRAAQAALDETYVQTRAGYGLNAQIQASANYEELRGAYFRDYSSGEHQEGRGGTIDLALSQPLYTGGRQKAALTAAQADILSGRENLRQTEIQIVQQVISAYVGVRRDMQILDVYRDTVAALERQLEQVRAEFAVRQVTQTDVDETTGRLASARSNVAGAMAQLEASRAQYLALVGENPVDLEPEPELDQLPNNLDGAFDLAEAHSAQILSARFSQEGAEARVAEARRGYAPQVSLRVDVTRSPVEPYQPALGEEHGVAASLNLTQSLFTSGLVASQVRQQLAYANQAREQVEQARRTTVQNVSQAWAQMTASRAALQADALGVKATQAAFYGVRREEPFGLRQPIDVLNAVLELNQAEIRLLQDRFNEYTARAGVLASAGLLEAALVVPDLDRIRPETNFRKVANSGALPWEGLVRGLDGIGAPKLHDPRPADHDDAADHPDGKAPPPPPPPAAKDVAAFQSATAIMAAEHAGAPPPGAPAADAPLSRCTRTESERLGCEAGAATAPALTGGAPQPPAP